MIGPHGLLPFDTPAPREVFLAGCRQIADALSTDGFIYAASSRKLTRKEGNFTFRISFQSSRYNVTGWLVQLWIHASVHSKILAAWRAAQPHALSRVDNVAGGPIGHLLPTPLLLEWNLANPDRRAAAVCDAVDTIRRIALPYFAQFQDVLALCRQLVSSDVPAMQWSLPIDFLLCFADRQQAEAYLHRLLSADPKLFVHYLRELSAFRRDGLPAAIHAHLASELAYVTLAYELTPPAHA